MGPDRSEQAARRFTFGDSELWMSADGAVSAVRHPVRDHSMLLEEDPEAPEAVMHDAARRWGKGFVVTDRGGHRFDAPAEQSWAADGVDLVHRWPGLDLNIGRHVGTSWSETYELPQYL